MRSDKPESRQPSSAGQYEIYVREAIEKGLADIREGRVFSIEEVRARYGLPNA